MLDGLPYRVKSMCGRRAWPDKLRTGLANTKCWSTPLFQLPRAGGAKICGSPQ